MTRINVSGSLIMFYFIKLKCSTTPSDWIMLSLLTLNVFASNFSHFPHFYLGCVVTISVWESWGLLQSPLLPAALEDRSVTIICIFLWKALECVVVWCLYSQLHVLLNRFVRITSLKSDRQNMHHDLWCPRKEVLSQGKCRFCLFELPLRQGQNKEHSEIWRYSGQDIESVIASTVGYTLDREAWLPELSRFSVLGNLVWRSV